MTNEQIKQKTQQLKQLAEEVKQLKDELVEAGAWPLNEKDLDKVAGGNPRYPVVHPEKGTIDWIEVPDSVMPAFTRPKEPEIKEPVEILPPPDL